jgi:hypothetical protein
MVWCFRGNLTPNPFPSGKGDNRARGASMAGTLRFLTIFERYLDVFCQFQIFFGYAACVVG